MDYQQQAQDGFRFYVPRQLTFPDAAIEQYEYDALGNMTRLTDRAGDESTFTYDERGQLLTLTNPLGGIGRYTPNADGSLAEGVDPGGVTRTYLYDRLKRIQTIRNGDGSERNLEVDDADNIVRVTNELGHAVQIEYDDNDRIRTMTDPLGNARRFEYDGNSRLAGFTDRTGNNTTVDYDPVGNVSEIRNGAGEAVRYQYDGRNQLTSVADAVGTGVEYGYDDEGRLTSVTDGLGKTGTLTQDKAGRVTGLTAPGGQRIDYIYDTVGRLTSIRNPTGRLREFTYDARGNLSRVDVDGITTGYEFNALGELDVLIGPNGDRWLRDYDGGGRQTSLTDPLGRVIEYSYDQLGRRNEIQTPLGLTSRTFDAAGRLTRNQLFDGTTYDYTYDENNMLLTTARLAFRRNNESQIVDSNGILTEYDAARRIRKITHAPAKEVTYDYDARGRLTQLSDWTGGETRFIYDAANRRTRIERPNGVATDFTYDENDAVTGVRHSGPAVAAEVTLERDDDGQITSATFRYATGCSTCPWGAGPYLRRGTPDEQRNVRRSREADVRRAPAIPLGRQLDSDRVRRRRRNGRVYLRRAGEPHVAHNGRGHEDLRIELCAPAGDRIDCSVRGCRSTLLPLRTRRTAASKHRGGRRQFHLLSL